MKWNGDGKILKDLDSKTKERALIQAEDLFGKLDSSRVPSIDRVEGASESGPAILSSSSSSKDKKTEKTEVIRVRKACDVDLHKRNTITKMHPNNELLRILP